MLISQAILDAANILDEYYKKQENDDKTYFNLISEHFNIGNDNHFKEYGLTPNKNGLIQEHSKLGKLSDTFDFSSSSKEIIEVRKYSNVCIEFVVKIKLVVKANKNVLKFYEKIQMVKEESEWKQFNATALLEYME